MISYLIAPPAAVIGIGGFQPARTPRRPHQRNYVPPVAPEGTRATVADTATTPAPRPVGVRDKELRALAADLDRIGRGSGHLADVAGEPGTGKTRLLAAVAAEAARRGLAVVHLRCT